MEKKELIKLYLQNVDKMFGYANMNAYIDERLKKYTKYCQSKKPEEQIIIWLKLLHKNFGKKIVYLGSYLALQEKDMSYLNNAFNSAVTWGQLTITNSGCDHSIHAWNILPHIFCANRFRDIEKIFPKENGLSKNGLKSACSITNLVMYLYYQEPMWKQYVIDESKEFLQNKHTAEEKAVINGFLALIEKNWEKSVEKFWYFIFFIYMFIFIVKVVFYVYPPTSSYSQPHCATHPTTFTIRNNHCFYFLL